MLGQIMRLRSWIWSSFRIAQSDILCLVCTINLAKFDQVKLSLTVLNFKTRAAERDGRRSSLSLGLKTF